MEQENTFDDNFDDELDDELNLRSSGYIEDETLFPPTFIDSISEVLANETDIYTLLIMNLYLFKGKNIKEIREQFVIQEGNKTKLIPRENVKNRIKNTILAIKKLYIEKNGGCDNIQLIDNSPIDYDNTYHEAN